MRAIEVYAGSDGEATTLYYAELERRGPIGQVAVNLLRAQKCSTRAKVYRGGVRGQGSYKRMAYDRKNWAISNLCEVLGQHGAALGIEWGWKEDPKQEFHRWVLYLELGEIGQVSFHAATRGSGPDYVEDWDGTQKSAERICLFCDRVHAQEVAV